MQEIDRMKKYPRTPHIAGSRLQAGDEDLSQISPEIILGRHIVIEEKVDGANCGISFSPEGELLLQSRGHYLIGGARERDFNLFKQWANMHCEALYEVLGSRYIVYGEWLYVKHKIYYDRLPHYFLEFDVWDKQKEVFLDTPSRQLLLSPLPIVSVPVLASGKFSSLSAILSYMGNSRYISAEHLENLRKTAEQHHLDVETILRETDPSLQMEGLYIKVEEEGMVVDRMKYVRHSYLQNAEESTKRWLDRPIVPNQMIGNLFDC